MKKLLISVMLILMFPIAAVYAEGRIENHAFNTPVSVETNRQALANHLTRPFSNDYDKLKAIAYWIASHIAYDGYKYNSGKIDAKESRYEYDILQYRTGICEDFAKLFADLANRAGIRGVEYVTGYVLENQRIIKSIYGNRDVKGETGHAWNRVKLNGRTFFVDTTFMARGHIGGDKIRPAASLKHKTDLKKRKFERQVNTQINEFFFDFTPKQEVKEYQMIHLMDKYVH